MTLKGGWPPTGFGLGLKARREKLKLSQQEIAVRAGCHWSTVAKLEQGRQEPALPLALALADAVGVALADLLSPPAARGQAADGRSRKAVKRKGA
jgi:transcriptional regulator with XRE-family HTH domain